MERSRKSARLCPKVAFMTPYKDAKQVLARGQSPGLDWGATCCSYRFHASKPPLLIVKFWLEIGITMSSVHCHFKVQCQYVALPVGYWKPIQWQPIAVVFPSIVIDDFLDDGNRF